MRALTSHQCGPGSILARCHVCVEFVVGSGLATRVFSLYVIINRKVTMYVDNAKKISVTQNYCKFSES